MSRTLRPEAPADATAAWRAVSAVFGSLGRIFVCLDRRFDVLHASLGIDDVLGEGAAATASGRPADALFGPELFGPRGVVRSALERGERLEGWRAVLTDRHGTTHGVALTAAPLLVPATGPACDPRVAFIVVLRPMDGLEAEDGCDGEHLRRVLEAHRWNRSRAAQALGISRVTLWRRMRQQGLV